MKPTKLIKSKKDPTLYLCECGQQVVEAYFDELGYLHTSSVECCPKCGRPVDEDLLEEDDVVEYDSY